MPQASHKFEKGVSALLFAYNEERLIEGCLRRMTELLDSVASDFEIILVDDASTDRTAEIARAFAAREPRLRVVSNDRNRNVAYSFKRGVQDIRKEFFFWQTVDWSYDISNLRIMLELLLHYDVVIGIRPTPTRLLSSIPVLRSVYRVRTRSDNFARAIQSLGYYYLIRLLYGTQFHDTQGVHLHRTALVQGLRLESDSVFVGVEMLIKLFMKGATFIEVPVPFTPRRQGVGKGGRVGYIVRTLREALGHWSRWGWKERQRLAAAGRKRQIYRVTEPVFLDEEVIRLVSPLFRYFR